MNLIIFSKPIHSGKTSELFRFCKQNNPVSGILMPEMNGTKLFYDIANKSFFNAEIDQLIYTENDIENIGKYNFSKASFAKANNIILNVNNKINNILIIDEVGKLELQKKGFHPALIFLLTSTNKINLLIVVRDVLIKEVTDFYQISHYKIISDLDELILP